MKQLIIFVVLCLPLLYSCGVPQQQETDTAYKTLTIKSGDQILKTGYTATLRGRQNVEIRPQVSGIITEICINEGDAVHKGQTLFIIDQIPYKAALQTAIANVKSAEAKLATAKLTADSKAELYKEQVVSEFDLQTARNEQIAAEAALAQAKAQEVNARNDLSYTEVKSPVDGVASMIPYRVGALVNSSITEPLVTVSDDSEVYAYFSMTENQILDFVQQYGSLKKAIEHLDKVELTMSNGKTYSSLGKVDAISGTIDEGTGAISLRAVFSNPDQFLRNGGSGTVVVPTVKKQCIIIPQAATYELQNRIFVYKVVDSKAQSAPVEVFRLNNGTEYVVEDGLALGDVIIAEGAGLVREGTVIKSEPTKE
ncbi:efflux RND transporter periplasmic adaptor subunit [Bacteroides thetaiotaomicron]|uniref:efflux RND transporter periplasmic adaptor subunit n=1 Tax=Bacteroides thetaiotaomicron TaxID=818 RepID=UPI0034A2BC7C